jgi:hypothetical protein
MRRAGALTVALAAALAAGAPSGSGSTAEPASVSSCKVLSPVGGGQRVPRPPDGGPYAFTGPEAVPLGDGRVLVHYTTVGEDAPPKADGNGNGRPDYVEKVLQAAGSALGFFAAPVFDGKAFPGFQSDLCDTGGPDSRLDVYVRDLGGTLGRSFGPARAGGGAFVLVSPRLADRPHGQANFKGDGIAFTVSHELFHLVQFGYVPHGMPGWIGEGTANTLAFFFTGVDHPVLLHQADMWLRSPSRPLWYPGFSCDRCYGGIWWWASYKQLLRSYFEHLATEALEPEGVGQGVAALEAAFQGYRPEDARFVPSALAMDFAHNFTPALQLALYPAKLGPPPAKILLIAFPRAKTRTLTLRPLSVQYVRVRPAARARSFELKGQASGGPAPLMSLLLGVRYRREASALFTRTVSPCFVTFPPGYATYTNRVAVDVRSRLERRNNVLVVANPSTKTVRYTLRYQSSARPAVSPSPTEDKSLKGAFCQKRGDLAKGGDPLGDAEPAPDLGALNVTATTTPASGETFLMFALEFPYRVELARGDLITVWLDTDRRPTTGCTAVGAEYALVVTGLPGPDSQRLGRCRNGAIDFGVAQGSFLARFDGDLLRTLVLVATPGDLRGARRFNFRVEASWQATAGGQVYVDSAPDGSGAYCFPTCGRSFVHRQALEVR